MRTALPGLPGAQDKTYCAYGTTTATTETYEDAGTAPTLTNPIPADDDPDTGGGGGGGGNPAWDPDGGEELAPDDPRRKVLEPAGV